MLHRSKVKHHLMMGPSLCARAPNRQKSKLLHCLCAMTRVSVLPGAPPFCSASAHRCNIREFPFTSSGGEAVSDIEEDSVEVEDDDANRMLGRIQVKISAPTWAGRGHGMGHEDGSSSEAKRALEPESPSALYSI